MTRLEELDMLSQNLHMSAADAEDLYLHDAVDRIDEAIDVVLDKMRELEDIA